MKFSDACEKFSTFTAGKIGKDVRGCVTVREIYGEIYGDVCRREDQKGCFAVDRWMRARRLRDISIVFYV